jgi:hypothetical protein
VALDHGDIRVAELVLQREQIAVTAQVGDKVRVAQPGEAVDELVARERVERRIFRPCGTGLRMTFEVGLESGEGRTTISEDFLSREPHG